MVALPSLRVVFFGTPGFAVPTLEALLQSAHAVVAVVTQPDRPHGRGHHTANLPVKRLALSAGLRIAQPDRLKDPAFLDEMTAFRSDLGVVVAYGKILPVSLLAIPPLGMVNVHASLLPRHRGAAPVNRAIIAGDRETGVTIMQVVKELDAGPMLATARRAIGPDETSEEVERDLGRIGAALLVSTVDDIAAGRARQTPQNEAGATYAHRLTREDGLLDWRQPAARIHDLVRGLHPWPHAFTFLHGRRLILLRSAWTSAPGGDPGTILEAEGDRLVVAAGSGTVQILQIQPEGKRPMTAREFLAGHRLAPGDRFSGP